MIRTILILLVIASWVYWVVAFWFVRRFFSKSQGIKPDFTPPVSILKPVKGVDNQAYQNFVSFCYQDYPEYEILFGVSDPDDPVIPVIEKLKNNFPQITISLIIVRTKWVNQKASILHGLASKARYKLFVVSDSDMKVTPDYLKKVVSPMADRKIGLVTCPYRGINPVTLTARLEAIYMGSTFLPSMMVARKFLDMRFAMGATVVIRETDLQRMGGFAAVAEYLADDYQLGLRITDLGLRVHLSDYIVSSVLGPTTFQEQWFREVRWAHCNRVSRPIEYPGIIITFSTPLSTLLLIFSDFSPLAWQFLVISLSLRWILTWLIFEYTQNQPIRKWLLWLPLRDMLSALVWCVGAIGKTVEWRGNFYSLTTDGRLELRKATKRSIIASTISWMIFIIDDIYQQYYFDYEFISEGENIFRLAISKSEINIVLHDGTEVDRGDTIGELCLRNGHIPEIPLGGPDLQWAVKFQRNLNQSLGDLVDFIQKEPDFQNINVFHGELSFIFKNEPTQWEKYFERMGFELVKNERYYGLWGNMITYFQRLYAYCLIWASNSTILRNGFTFRELKRKEVWISRTSLIKNYGSQLSGSQKVEKPERSEKLTVS